MLRGDVQKWTGGGKCEAGVPVSSHGVRQLPPCDKRARWMVAGALLCGGCKRLVMAAPHDVSYSESPANEEVVN